MWLGGIGAGYSSPLLKQSGTLRAVFFSILTLYRIGIEIEIEIEIGF
jgi:hypothetical protein